MNIAYDALTALVLCCIFLLVSLLIWLFKGRDDDLIVVREHYPPDGLNCVELAYIYKGAVDRRDVVPLLLELSQKGYLSIEQVDQKGKVNCVRILKPYDGNNESEKIFMHGLSQYGNIVEKQEITESFYRILDAVIISIRKNFKEKVFYKNTLILRNITWVFAIIPYFIGVYPTVKNYYPNSNVGTLFSIMFIVATCIIVSGVTITFGSKALQFYKKIIVVIAGPALLALLIRFFGEALGSRGMIYQVVYWSCVVANIFQIIFLLIIDKRKPYGIDMLGRVMGYREHIEEASTAQLENDVKNDPEYFSKNLACAFEFNMSGKWMKKFNDIPMDMPKWYGRFKTDPYSYKTFCSFITLAMAEYTVAMTSTPKQNRSR